MTQTPDDQPTAGDLLAAARNRAKTDPTVRLLQFCSDGRKFDLPTINLEVRDYETRIAQDFIEIGKRLVWVRQELGHGGFVRWLDTNVRMGRATAYNAMKVVEALADRPSLQPISRLGVSKALELIGLPDADLEEFEEKGTLLERGLDDVDRMSVRELRDEVRRRKKKVEKLEEEVGKKTDELAGRDRRIQELEYGRFKDPLRVVRKIQALEHKHVQAWAQTLAYLDELDLDQYPADVRVAVSRLFDNVARTANLHRINWIDGAPEDARAAHARVVTTEAEEPMPDRAGLVTDFLVFADEPVNAEELLAIIQEKLNDQWDGTAEELQEGIDILVRLRGVDEIINPETGEVRYQLSETANDVF